MSWWEISTCFFASWKSFKNVQKSCFRFLHFPVDLNRLGKFSWFFFYVSIVNSPYLGLLRLHTAEIIIIFMCKLITNFASFVGLKIGENVFASSVETDLAKLISFFKQSAVRWWLTRALLSSWFSRKLAAFSVKFHYSHFIAFPDEDNDSAGDPIRLSNLSYCDLLVWSFWKQSNCQKKFHLTKKKSFLISINA